MIGLFLLVAFTALGSRAVPGKTQDGKGSTPSPDKMQRRRFEFGNWA